MDLIWRSLLQRHKGHLFALHNNPPWASGGERNHKVAKRAHICSRAQLGKHKIETGTAILFNSKQLDRQIARTRDPKLCNISAHNGYEAELEEVLVNEDEDGGGDHIDEFNRVDISKGINGMHDEDIFEGEEVMDKSNIYKWGGSNVV